MLAELTKLLVKDVLLPLRQMPYFIGNARIPFVTLFDHLSLTAGFAVATVCELQVRGFSAEQIFGKPIPEPQTLPLARLCGYFHDIGKSDLDVKDYHHHVQRGVEWTKNCLKQQNVDEPLFSIIVGAVKRHHLQDEPQTVFEKLLCLANIYASAGDRPELASTPNELQSTTQMIQDLERELFGNEKPICLLMGDADAIKAFVYETTKLPDIRGGSEILAELEEKVREKFRRELSEDCLIYCGGGGFLAILPTSEAQKWKQEIERLYLEQAKTATITVVASQPIGYLDLALGFPPYNKQSLQQFKGKGLAEDLLFSHFEAIVDDRAKRKNFGELVAELAARLQKAKREKANSPTFPALPVHFRCQACGKRPSVHRDEVTGEWICQVCQMKRNRGRAERRSFLDDFKAWFEQKYSQILQANIPSDLEELVETEGRIAFLYTDGNNMGDFLQKAKSPANYRHLSETLSVATKESLFEALTEVIGEGHLKQLKSTEPLPFEIIAVGGDDVAVIVPAKYGWLLALKLLEKFETHPKIKALSDELGKPLTMSAGLVIADVKYPVRFVESLSESLLKEAKRLAREKNGSVLCHLWLRAPIASEDAKPILEALYHRKKRNSKFQLTARPFTLKQAQKLTKVCQELKGVLTSSQRRALAESTEQGPVVSVNFALYQTAKQRKEEVRNKLHEVFRQSLELLDSDDDMSSMLFWRFEKGVWKTALLDALELLELGGV